MSDTGSLTDAELIALAALVTYQTADLEANRRIAEMHTGGHEYLGRCDAAEALDAELRRRGVLR